MSKHILLHLFIGLLLTMFIISCAVTAALQMKPIYHSDIDRYELTKVSGLTASELKQDYDELVNYNSIWGDDKLELPHFKLSDSAAKHFAEARDIFLFFGWGIIVFGMAALAMIRLSPRKQYGNTYLLVTSCLSIALPCILGIFAMTSWDKLFVLFHKISFGNDLWIFDPKTDPIINVLPEQFFLHEALAIFAFMIAGGIICLIAYIKSKSTKEESARS